jgi:uncharacterized repeat protein (TIGR01451 family)
VFSGSSSATYAGVYASGQKTTDVVNSFQSPPFQLKNGENSYTPFANRWGDYSGAALDPASPSTVWVAGEYVYISGGSEWGTYIAPVQIGSSSSSASADLQMVSKTGTPSSVVAGNDVTYTLVAKNNGPDAASNVVVTDTLPAGMTFKPTGSSALCSGSPTVNCSAGTLSSGTATTLTVIATVAASATPGAVTNTASVSSSTADPDSGNNSASTVTTITAPSVGAAPTVSACNPSSGNRNQQLTVQVTGSNFQSGATANFGTRVMIQSVTFVSATQVNVSIKVHPQAALGPRTVTITNPDGQSGGLAGCFTVN